MSKFIEKPANARSLAMRKLVYSVGINDAAYVTSYKDEDGKSVRCPYYVRWYNMLMRCYCTKSLEKCPTYRGCSVCDEWKVFTNFKRWMIKQDWEGKHLDKDLLVRGNKVYSPDTCIFVSSELNLLLLDSGASRGKYPQGVHWHKGVGKYVAHCNVGGKLRHIGCYDCVKEAENAYCTFKADVLVDVSTSAECVQQPRLREALLDRVKRLRKKDPLR